ncbi:DUF2285 domain-containing protein, partial [Pseudomonas aeruginosa]
VLAPGLAHGMAYTYAVRASTQPHPRCRALAEELDKLAGAAAPVVARPRPAATALLELHTLQALDGTLAGASLRLVADVLFGPEDWHADGALRARVRRLVRRGQRLMRGGYRRLAQLPTLAQGRSAVRAKRP